MYRPDHHAAVPAGAGRVGNARGHLDLQRLLLGVDLFIQSGDRLPVTTAINKLKGQFLDDYGLIAAGAMITLIPTLLIYAALQRQFVAGLTLGGSKGLSSDLLAGFSPGCRPPTGPGVPALGRAAASTWTAPGASTSRPPTAKTPTAGFESSRSSTKSRWSDIAVPGHWQLQGHGASPVVHQRHLPVPGRAAVRAG